MKKFFFGLALMATIGLGGLVIESASAQNTNSSTTMSPGMGSNRNMSMRRRHGRRHRRVHYRRHRRHSMTNKNANM